jgi:hypothetical protein
MKNRVSLTVTKPQEDDILADIAALRAKITALFTNHLTEDERGDLFRLADKRMAFDQKADDYLHQRPDLRPPTIELPEYDKDGALMACADRLLAALSTVTTPISDARDCAGNDRLDADLEFLHYLKFIARTGTPGAQEVHDDLSESYPTGRRGTVSNPPA